MNIRSLSAGLSFRGRVDGQRQAYYVFEGPKIFLVFSFSRSKPKAGYFNAVDMEAETGRNRSIPIQTLPQAKVCGLFAGGTQPPLCTGRNRQGKNRSPV